MTLQNIYILSVKSHDLLGERHNVEWYMATKVLTTHYKPFADPMLGMHADPVACMMWSKNRPPSCVHMHVCVMQIVCRRTHWWSRTHHAMQSFMIIQTVPSFLVFYRCLTECSIPFARLHLLACRFAQHPRLCTSQHRTLLIFYGIMMNNPVIDTPDPAESSMQVHSYPACLRPENGCCKACLICSPLFWQC